MLVITLLVVLLLTVIIFEIDFQSRADLRAAQNFRDDLSAYYLALSGVTAGKGFLEEDLRTAGTVDHLGEIWASTIPPFSIGDGEVSGKITDEAGKFNINTMLDAQGVPILFKKTQLENLFRLVSVDPTLVDAIIDWRDQNTTTISSNGAEDETYQALEFPYSAKNGHLATLEELLYIKGITKEVYEKISPYLTVSTLDGKINVNTANAIVLQSIDPIAIDESTAKKLVEGAPYDLVSKFTGSPLLGSANKNNIIGHHFTVGSNIYSIESRGAIQNTRKTIRVIWNRAGNGQVLSFKVE